MADRKGTKVMKDLIPPVGPGPLGRDLEQLCIAHGRQLIQAMTVHD